eukprot:scaffold314873_cov31-Prasinocladus_malaysianus.AAC.2
MRPRMQGTTTKLSKLRKSPSGKRAEEYAHPDTPAIKPRLSGSQRFKRQSGGMARVCRCISAQLLKLSTASESNEVSHSSVSLASGLELKDIDFGSHPDVLCTCPEIDDWDEKNLGKRFMSNFKARASLDVSILRFGSFAQPRDSARSSLDHSSRSKGTQSDYQQRPRVELQRQPPPAAAAAVPWDLKMPEPMSPQLNSPELRVTRPPIGKAETPVRQRNWRGATTHYNRANRASSNLRLSNAAITNDQCYKPSRPSDNFAVENVSNLHSTAAKQLRQRGGAVEQSVATMCGMPRNTFGSAQ